MASLSKRNESDTKTLSDTIIYTAKERMKVEKFQNINSAIIAVCLEVDQLLMEFMSHEK